MKISLGFKPCRSRAIRCAACGTLLLVAALTAGGCGAKAEDAAQTQVMAQNEGNSRLQAIQNDPHLSPEAKQNAINTIKSQQALTAQGQAGSPPR